MFQTTPEAQFKTVIGLKEVAAFALAGLTF